LVLHWPQLHTTYCIARKKLKMFIRRSKRECFLQLCDSAESDPWGRTYKTVIKRIHTNNSVAPDEPEQLRAIVETLFATSVYNLPVNSEELLGPFAVEPVTGKLPDEPFSYHPICLIDSMGKVLEQVIFTRLEKAIEVAGGLSPKQFRFRKGRVVRIPSEAVEGTVGAV